MYEKNHKSFYFVSAYCALLFQFVFLYPNMNGFFVLFTQPKRDKERILIDWWDGLLFFLVSKDEIVFFQIRKV